MIEARTASARRGSAEVVSHVSFTVGPGELAAVIGPNGAGKSTLLAMLAGDLAPSSGEIYLDNRPLTSIDRADRALLRAVLPQGGVTDIPFSVGEVVAMGRHPHRRRPDNSAAADQNAVWAALNRTDTAALAKRRFATLSGGERTRVSLARVLAQNTAVLLLDEPTTALDVGHEAAVMQELRRLAGAGRTVVAVMHDLNDAARFSTRVIALDRGRLVADGAPNDVLTAELLTTIYGHPMRVIPHPYDDCPLILPEG
jgi:iron complex transport system ATP-binding protein